MAPALSTPSPRLPFVVRYSLSRRQRLTYELFPWLPALAGTLGFGVGVAYLCWTVHSLFALLLLLPPLAYRGLFLFLWDVLRRSRVPVELYVDQSHLRWQMPPQAPRTLPLEGIIQVCRTSDPTRWDILHRDGTVIPLPQNAVTPEQLDYLRAFALRAAAQRRRTSA